MVFVFLVLADQLTKLVFLKHYPILISLNPGGAFSVGDTLKVFPLIAFIVLVGLIIFAFKTKIIYQSYYPLSLIVSGALSNQIDRLVRGGVVDYINLGFLPVFNLADMLIVGGFAWFILGYLLKKRPKPSA